MNYLEYAQRAVDSNARPALQEQLDQAVAALEEQKAQNLELQRQLEEVKTRNAEAVKAIVSYYHSHVTSLQSSILATARVGSKKFNALLDAYGKLEQDFDELLTDYLKLGYRELLSKHARYARNPD